MKALAAMWRAPTNVLTSLISLGWGAPRKLSSKRSSLATRTLLTGRTDCVLSPSRKAAPSITSVGAEVSGTGLGDPRLRLLPSSWEGTRSCRDPPEYTGRAVDVAFWVIPDRTSAIAGLREWLTARAAKHVNPQRKPDLAHEPVILIHPNLGTVAWDPDVVPPPGQRQLDIANPMAWCRPDCQARTCGVLHLEDGGARNVLFDGDSS